MTELTLPYAFRELETPSRHKAFHGSRGSAKCLARGTGVLMFDGTVRCVEDVREGDLLMGPDSAPRRVLALSRGEGPLYRVKQKSAMDYVVNENHILSLHKRKQTPDIYKKTGQIRRIRYSLYDEFIDLNVLSFDSSSETFKNNFHGYKVPVRWPVKALPIPPYILGVWLGDGDKNRIWITNPDPEVVESFLEYGRQEGCRVGKEWKKGAYQARIITPGGRRTNPVYRKFLDLGVINNKHIPDQYIANDDNNRLEILAGIIDSDGSLQSNTYNIVAKKGYFANQIKRIADSLGFKTSLKPLLAKCRDKRHTAWRVRIGGNVDKIPVRVERKKIKSISKNKDWRRCRLDIEYFGEGEFFGFEIDKDHRFLLEDGTVTHNSHSFAQSLVLRGYQRRDLRWLCAREIQRSLSASVKQLMEDKIREAGLGPRSEGGNGYYRSTQNAILGGDGRTHFMFYGLRTNPETVKSIEGLDGAWIEEADRVSQRSINILTPTIRKENSELWWSWNRRSTTDPVDAMFLGGTPPPRSIVRRVTHADNPFFPEVLREEMEWDKSRDRDKWLHVWEGHPVVHSEARVFHNWRVEDIDDQIPEDCVPRLGGDWGFSIDPTCLIECYVWGRTLYIRREAYKVRCAIDEIPSLFAGSDWREPERWKNPFGHPGIQSAREGFRITADSARPETIAYLKARGFNIKGAKKGARSIEEGVEFINSFDVIIHPECTRSEAEFTYYKFKTDPLTDEVLPILEDKDNHVIDSCRYALEGVRRKRRQIATGGAETVELDSAYTGRRRSGRLHSRYGDQGELDNAFEID